jgi:hypothetical protein
VSYEPASGKAAPARGLLEQHAACPKKAICRNLKGLPTDVVNSLFSAGWVCSNFLLASECFLWAVNKKNLLRAQNFGIFISTLIVLHLILTKHGLGYVLGDRFTNSSGHPDMICRLLDLSGLQAKNKVSDFFTKR